MLLFIRSYKRAWWICNQVSIHLMLLFIVYMIQRCGNITRFNTSHVVVYLFFSSFALSSPLSFNTSHVVVYHVNLTTVLFPVPCFNTSHVVVYQSCYGTSRPQEYVSIHLMLLFIGFLHRGQNFFCRVSIHLMLLFIRTILAPFNDHSSVSIHLMLLFIFKQFLYNLCTHSFNTSHVVVYPSRRAAL